MRIILDSNVIIRDYHQSGYHFQALFDGLARAGHSLYIPQVVIDEVENKYAQDLVKARDWLAKAQRVIGEIESPLTDASGDEVIVEQYRKSLLSRFTDARASIIGYPDVHHEAVVQRALNRRRPFKPSGKGYRDTLIWENVMNLASSPGQDIAFVSGNNKDFFDEEGNLHPDLLADMHEQGIRPGRIAPFDSLEEFVDRHITPELQACEEIRQQLELDEYPGISLRDLLLGGLPFISSRHELNPAELGFPPEFENPTLGSVQGIANIHVTDVRRLSSGEYLTRIEADADCQFFFSVLGTTYHAMLDEKAPLFQGYDSKPGYVYASASKTVHIQVGMIFDPARPGIWSFHLLHMGTGPSHQSERVAR